LGTPFEIMGEMTRIYKEEPKRLGEIRHLWKELRNHITDEELLKKGDYWANQYSYMELIENVLPEIFNHLTYYNFYEQIKKATSDMDIITMLELFDKTEKQHYAYLDYAIPEYKRTLIQIINELSQKQ
jgi:hypothetical protein